MKDTREGPEGTSRQRPPSVSFLGTPINPYEAPLVKQLRTVIYIDVIFRCLESQLGIPC